MNAQALCSVTIGRDEELAILEDALFASARGDGSVVAIAGDAGLGKTRLANELAARARALGAAVLSGGCTEAEIGLPYLPFVEAIGNWLAGLDLDEARDRLGPAAAALAQLFPQLGDAPVETADPMQARLRLYEGILGALRAAGTGRGVLVIVEDIHWADASTRELLDYMTRRLKGSPSLVLVTFRPDELHRKHPLLPIVQGWRRSRGARFIELSPLPADDVARVIGAIFNEEVSDDFRDLMFDRTEGNPFAIEEMLKEAVDRGDIYRTATGWDRKALQELRIPRSVAEGILLRVERLDPQQADVLRAASVMGQTFSYETLVTATSMDETAVIEALEVCVQQQLLDEEPRTPGRYRFRHALTREAVYEDVISPRRRQMHGRVADVLRDDPRSTPAELAYHLTAAGREQEAVPACLAAAEQALARLGTREATELFERALPYVTDDRERGSILRKMGEAGILETSLGPAEKYLREAIDTFERAGETGSAAACRIALGRVMWIRNEPQRALAEYEQARAELEPLGPSRELALVYIRLAGMHLFSFEPEATREMAERAIQVAERSGADHERVWGYGFLGSAILYGGDVEAGRRWQDRGIDEAIAKGFYDVATNGIHNAAGVCVEFGRARETFKILERFQEVPPHRFRDFSFSFTSGMARYMLGPITEAEQQLLEAKRIAEEMGQDALWGTWVRYWLARVYTDQGRLDEAASILPEGGDIQVQERKQAAESRLRLALAREDIDAAAAEAEKLIVVSGGLGAARAHALAVEVFVRAGRLADAKVALASLHVDETSEEYAFVLQARGRIALVEGDGAEAVEGLRGSAGRFGAMGYVLYESETRALLAVALHGTGSSGEVESELRSAFETALSARAVLLQRAIRSTADELGVVLPEPSETSVGSRAEEAAGERLVTVLFADVRGYTAMTNREAPADMVQRMTTFYRWARRAIEHEGGLIDAYAGDAVMASFNVTRADLDHCVAALRAAVAMQDKASVQELPVGIGIAVGPAVVGRLTGGKDVNVIGQTTNLAARLQAHAESGEIVLDEEAFRRTHGWLEHRGIVVDERTLTLKGFEGETRVYVAVPGRKPAD